MDMVRVLITGGGAPGIVGTLYSLKNNYDGRKIYTVCVDAQNDVVGKYLCDKFYRVPYPEEPSFMLRIIEICTKENIDVILPQVTRELPVLSKNIELLHKHGVEITISSHNSILVANNKYELMKTACKLGLPCPKFKLVSTWDELLDAAYELGYPQKPVVVKPPVSNGMRGLRIIDPGRNWKKAFYIEKPNGLYIKLSWLYDILGDKFDKLIVMEYLPGSEYTVDVLAYKGKIHVIIPRKRLEVKMGITFKGIVEKNIQIIKQASKLSNNLNLEFAHGFQFKLDSTGAPKILECNPRIQGTMVISTLAGANIIYDSIKLALGEKIKEYSDSDIKWNLKFLRYWGGIKVDNTIEHIIPM